MHPYYDEDNKAGYVVNDFTILKLSSKVSFSQYPHIRPACLPTSRFRNYDSVSGIVAGWGNSEIRTETQGNIVKGVGSFPKDTLHKLKVRYAPLMLHSTSYNFIQINELEEMQKYL